MRRGLIAVVLTALVAVGGWFAWTKIRDARREYTSTDRSHIERFAVKSKLLGRTLHEVLVTPPGGGRRFLLVLLHGRSSSPDSFLSDPFFRTLERLGTRAPSVLLLDGGDHSYWHDRDDGPWGSYVLDEAIPAGLRRSGRPPRVAIGGVSMGGFGALRLGLFQKRFCAVGGHSAALWFAGGDTPAGAFDDAEDFARSDVIRFAGNRPVQTTPVWIDAGSDDPFLAADTALAQKLRARGVDVRLHSWPGGHSYTYWDAHMPAYLRFYARACARR